MRALLDRGRERITGIRFAARRYRWEGVPHCICGSDRRAVAATRRQFGRELRLVLCESCGLGRLSPRLAEDDLGRYYRRDYRLFIRGTTAIDNAYFDRGRRRGSRIIERLAEAMSLPAPETVVVEFGAGAGGILAAFRERGYAVAGCDLDPACVEFARSKELPVVLGEAVEVSAPVGLVVLSHLIEHLPQPLEALGRVRRLCAPETLLYVELPGLRAEPRRTWEQLQLPHLYYYDLTTLRWLLGRAGFALVDGDETVTAVFRPADPFEHDTRGNFERNRAWLAS